MGDIFSFDDLSDLKSDTISSLESKLFSIPDIHKRILSLFSIKDPLSIDEVLIGLDRTTGIGYKRLSVYKNIIKLTKRGFLEKQDNCRGVYRLTAKGNMVLKMKEAISNER
jgi:hypothetical protein